MPPPKRKKDSAALAKMMDELSSLPIDEIRKQLHELGKDPGPVDSSNKGIYIRLLAKEKLQASSDVAAGQPVLAGRSPSSSVATGSPRLELGRKPLVSFGTISSHALRPSPATRGTKRKAMSLVSDSTSPISSPPVSKRPRDSSKYASKAKKKLDTSSEWTESSDVSEGDPAGLSAYKAIRDFQVVGLTAATFTPFTTDGELNLSVIGEYADWLLSCGVHYIFLNGTTGESLSLTVDERKILAEEWIRVAAGRLSIIVHVGTENLKYTCELAEHAAEIGAVAIGVMPTTFFKPPSIDHLITYLELVGEAAPNLPMYYYHIPSATGVKFSMEEFLDSAGTRLPTLRGVKYSDPDLADFGRCVIRQKYQMIYGCDEQVIGALALGGIAAIGSTYNYAGKLNNRLFQAYQRKNTSEAMKEQRRSQAMIKILKKYGGHPGTGKAFMKICCGIDCGPPRLPLLQVSAVDLRSLRSDLDDIGFFHWD